MRVPLYPFATPVRDYSEMARRYTHMFVCPDLVKVVFKWAQVREGAEVSVVNKLACRWQVQGSPLYTARTPQPAREVPQPND